MGKTSGVVMAEGMDNGTNAFVEEERTGRAKQAQQL